MRIKRQENTLAFYVCAPLQALAGEDPEYDWITGKCIAGQQLSFLLEMWVIYTIYAKIYCKAYKRMVWL